MLVKKKVYCVEVYEKNSYSEQCSTSLVSYSSHNSMMSNDGPILSKTDYIAEYALGRAYRD